MTKNLKRPFTATARPKSAIALGWEVQTAKLQDANGLSNAGLSELERSANLGRTTGLIASIAPAAGTLEDWNLTSDYYKKGAACARIHRTTGLKRT